MTHTTLYFTDIEGDKVRLEQFLALNKNNGVVIKKDAEEKDYIHIPDGVTLVFGGDLIDRFESDMYLVNLMLNTAKNNQTQAGQKQKFVFIAGNREVNKERYEELNDAHIKAQIAVPTLPFWPEAKDKVFTEFLLEQMFISEDARLKDLLPADYNIPQEGAVKVAFDQIQQINLDEAAEMSLIATDDAEKDKKVKAIKDTKAKLRTPIVTDLKRKPDAIKYLQEQVVPNLRAAEGLSMSDNNNEVLQYFYLVWMHRDTMGCPNTVAYRTKELSLKNRGEVLNHFKDSVKTDGWVRKLLAITQLFYTDGKIFVTHGKAPENLALNDGKTAKNLNEFSTSWNNWYKTLLGQPKAERAKNSALLTNRLAEQNKTQDPIMMLGLPENSLMTCHMNVETKVGETTYHYLEPSNATADMLKRNGIKLCMTGHKPLSKLGQIRTVNNVTFAVPDTSNFEERCVFVEVREEDGKEATVKMTCIERPAKEQPVTGKEAALVTELVAGDDITLVGSLYTDINGVPGVIRTDDKGKQFIQIAAQSKGSAFPHVNDSKEMVFPSTRLENHGSKPPAHLPTGATGAGVFGNNGNNGLPNTRTMDDKKPLLGLEMEQLEESDADKEARLNNELISVAKVQAERLEKGIHFYTFKKRTKAKSLRDLAGVLETATEDNKVASTQSLLLAMYTKRTHLSTRDATTWTALSNDNKARLKL